MKLRECDGCGHLAGGFRECKECGQVFCKQCEKFELRKCGKCGGSVCESCLSFSENGVCSDCR